MRGICLKCGCTAARACTDDDGAACAWIDDAQDLCSRCAQQLAVGPIEPATLAEAALVIRALRAAMFEIAERFQATQYLVEQVFSAAAAAADGPQSPNQIWTP